MKLRIRDNSIRLRLTQAELKLFEVTKKVEAVINFPGGTQMKYILIWRTDEMYQASFDGASVIVEVPHSIGKNWLRPSEVSIDHDIELTGVSKLRAVN